MTCDVIATGSTGNAVLLNRTVLIDCGVPHNKIEPYVGALRLVLLTHCHGDHFNRATVRRLNQERPTLRFGCCKWMLPMLISAGVEPRCIDLMQPGAGYLYGSTLTVSPVLLSHDVENCGWIINQDGERAIYATDTGTMDGVEAKGFDLYMIEANYTEAEMEERIRRKTESGEFMYEYRAAAGHLSREQADAWLAENATPGKSRVIFLHGHQEKQRKEERENGDTNNLCSSVENRW